MYYNTTSKTGKQLAKAHARAQSQDALVMNCICAIHTERKQITPRRVWAVYMHNYGPVELTSVRRSINTLLKQEKIQYTGQKQSHKCPIKNFTTTEKTIKLP